MLCRSRDDVLEEGCNIWSGEETDQFQPSCDIMIIHGLGSHPYFAFLSPPSRAPRRTSSGPFWNDSVKTIRSPNPLSSRVSFSSSDEPDPTPLLPPSNSPWSNGYSDIDILGRIGTFWPRDLLPLDARRARICTIGYRSRWTSSKFQTSLQECGEHLLTTLDHARRSRSAQHRPLVFIAHSFGGLVVLSALVSACMQDRFMPLRRSIAGCLFFGSPFGGCEHVGLLDVATSMSGNSQNILHSLRPGSRELEDLRREFAKAYGRKVPIVSFYERLKSDLGRSILVVPRESTMLGNARSIGLYKDHSDLVKYASSADESYQFLVAELKAMLPTTRRDKDRTGARQRQQYSGQQYRPPPRQSSLPIELDSSFTWPTSAGHRNDHLASQSGIEQPSRRTIIEANRYEPEPRQFQYRNGVVPPQRSEGQQRQVHSLSEERIRRPRDVSGNIPLATQARSAPSYATYVGEGGNTVRLPLHLQRSYNVLQTHRKDQGAVYVPQNTLTQSLLEPSYGAPIQGVSTPSFGPGQQKAIAEMDTARRQCTSPIPLSLLPRLQQVPPTVLESHLPSSFATPQTETRNTATAVRYLTRVEGPLQRLCESTIFQSRGHLLNTLMCREIDMLSASRVALTGPSGIGKSYLALACVSMIMESPDVSIFWLAGGFAADFREDCKSLADLIRIPTRNYQEQWNYLHVCIEHLAAGVLGRALVVLDDIPADQAIIDKLCDIDLRGFCQILITTRNRTVAHRMSKNNGYCISVPPFHPSYSAEVLSFDWPIPESPVFDELAFSLEHDPLVTVQVRQILRVTGIALIDFSTQLSHLLDERNWAASGPASAVGKALYNNKPQSHDFSSGDQSLLSTVLRSCLNSSWPVIFNNLAHTHPAASDLLSELSVLGRTYIPTFLLAGSSNDITARDFLLDNCFLDPHRDGYHASKLMLLAHRCWRLKSSGLKDAFVMALGRIANHYPDPAADLAKCRELEPFASVVTSPAADSWIGTDDSARRDMSVLEQKRRKSTRLLEELAASQR